MRRFPACFNEYNLTSPGDEDHAVKTYIFADKEKAKKFLMTNVCQEMLDWLSDYLGENADPTYLKQSTDGMKLFSDLDWSDGAELKAEITEKKLY